MAEKDKTLLMQDISETLRPRMFVNMYDEAVNEIQGKLDAYDVTHAGEDAMLSCDLLDAFIDGKRAAGRGESTLTRYRYVIEAFLRAENVTTRQVTAEHVRHWFSQELARGVRDSTVRGYREVLWSYFSWLADNRLISSNPMRAVEQIRCEELDRPAFSSGDLDVLRRHCVSIRNMAIIYFLISTGCRVSEMTALNRADVDLEAGECVVFGKGRKERTVFLTDEAVIVLREYLATREDDKEPLFLGLQGKRLQPGGVRAMLKVLSEQTGVADVHPHRFRRTMITRMLDHGMPIQEVAILAGHSDVDTTMGYYAASKEHIRNSFRLHSA